MNEKCKINGVIDSIAIEKTEKILNQMKNSICKIEGKEIGTGFFCELDNLPIKYGLFTNNHVLDESNIKIGEIINIDYLTEYKDIEITKNRKVFTNKSLDYTCIEIFKSDNIKHFFKIDSKLINNKQYLNGNDIYILQYPYDNDISFSWGKILSINNNKICHNASTKEGASGSPIIRRNHFNYIIGIHFGGNKQNKYNLGTVFDSILDDLKKNTNICKYEINKNAINFLNEYNANNNNNFFSGNTFDNTGRKGNNKNENIIPRINTPALAFKSIKEEFPFHQGIALIINFL